jgi:Family of unknown function (DUF5996)
LLHLRCSANGPAAPPARHGALLRAPLAHPDAQRRRKPLTSRGSRWSRTCTSSGKTMTTATTAWPSLPLEAWLPTRETLHRYTQIIGKIQLALTPMVNHFWNVALRVTARGLATPALRHNGRTFDIELDLIEHRLIARTDDGASQARDLRPVAVAEFYRDVLAMLGALGVRIAIWDRPVEIRTDPIPFSEDGVHAAYDREYVERFFRVLSHASQVLEQFRSRFTGKCSGVGFYWGTFDLSVARYSGRRAPATPPGTPSGVIDREAFSHEVSEAGFWPGDQNYTAPAFYALHYPAPDGFTRAAVRPSEARWEAASRSFVLPYEACREHDPHTKILEFCQSTYEAGANLAGWNRAELERTAEAGPRAP